MGSSSQVFLNRKWKIVDMHYVTFIHISGQEKGSYVHNGRYRCSNNTSYNGTHDMKNVQRLKPSKQRSKNTSCPFFMTIKVKKQVSKHFWLLFVHNNIKSTNNGKGNYILQNHGEKCEGRFFIFLISPEQKSFWFTFFFFWNYFYLVYGVKNNFLFFSKFGVERGRSPNRPQKGQNVIF